MTWTKLDDSFYDCPKIEEAGNELAGIFARSLTYCSRHLTDGRVPESVAIALARSKRTAGEMVASGLWDMNGSGYVIPDYLDYNPPREKVLDDRRKAADRKAAGRR